MVEEWCSVHLAGPALGPGPHISSAETSPPPPALQGRGEVAADRVRTDRDRLEGDGGRPPPSRPIPALCLPLWVLLRCDDTSRVPRTWVTQNTQPSRAVPARSSEDQGTRRRPGTRRGSRAGVGSELAARLWVHMLIRYPGRGPRPAGPAAALGSGAAGPTWGHWAWTQRLDAGALGLPPRWHSLFPGSTSHGTHRCRPPAVLCCRIC